MADGTVLASGDPELREPGLGNRSSVVVCPIFDGPGAVGNRFRRRYGALDLGTQSAPALIHPEQGRPLSHRTFLFLHKTHEYCGGPCRFGGPCEDGEVADISAMVET